MEYKDAIEYIHGLNRFGSKLGLERINSLTNALGNPQDKLKFIHIAGTNGKGSTAAFIASILKYAGYNTGLYTSPYVVRFNERIRINGNEIADADLVKYVEKVRNAIDKMMQDGLEHPTEFEVITALAFLYFYEKNCDVVVLEVGLGGRFDATNVISKSIVSVITKIAEDHTSILGHSLEEIAYEKSGIIKDNGIVVTYPQEKTALETIKTVCASKNAKLFYANPDELTGIEIKRGSLCFTHPRFGRLETSIVGLHQVNNGQAAIKTIEVLNSAGFSISKEHVVKGFKEASWLGRFELIGRDPDFYIDGAHNPDGIRSFVETFKAIYPDRKAIVIFGVMKDKDYETMVRDLSFITKIFIAVTPDTPRALSTESLVKLMRKYCKYVEYSDTIRGAVERSFSLASKDDIIASLGSLYYIGNVRQLVSALSEK